MAAISSKKYTVSFCFSKLFANRLFPHLCYFSILRCIGASSLAPAKLLDMPGHPRLRLCPEDAHLECLPCWLLLGWSPCGRISGSGSQWGVQEGWTKEPLLWEC